MESNSQKAIPPESQVIIDKLNKIFEELTDDTKTLKSQFKNIDLQIKEICADLTNSKKSKEAEPNPSTSSPNPSTSSPNPSTSSPNPSTSSPNPFTSRPNPSTSRVEHKKFQNPFSFFADVGDALGFGGQFLQVCDIILGDFLDGALSRDQIVLYMKSVFNNMPELNSGLELFLNTPEAVSNARMEFISCNPITFRVGCVLGFDSEEYQEYLNILDFWKDSTDRVELDRKLTALFKNTYLKNDVLRLLESIDSDERDSTD